MATAYIVGSFVFGCIFLSSLGSASAACGVLSHIPTQPNFDAYMYQGEWKEIAWIPPADLPVNEYFDAYTHNYAVVEGGNIEAAVAGRVRTGNKGCTYFTITWVPTELGAKFTLEACPRNGGKGKGKGK